MWAPEPAELEGKFIDRWCSYTMLHSQVWAACFRGSYSAPHIHYKVGGLKSDTSVLQRKGLNCAVDKKYILDPRLGVSKASVQVVLAEVGAAEG